MKHRISVLLSLILSILLLLSTSVTAFAHSGRTDSSGGHRDNKNISGLGSYHYHCGGFPPHLHSGGYCPYRDVLPSGVTVSVGNKTLRKGETTSFKAEVYPANSCDTSVDISCDNNQVIRISRDTITALDYGTAKITAKSFNGRSTTITITVKEIVPKRITVSSSVNKGETIYVGDTFKCEATLNPENVDNPAITWSSSDESIAKIDKKGNVTTLAEGNVVITATAANDVTGKLKIAVKEKKVKTVELSEDSLELLLQQEYDLLATITPEDATFPEITWSSSNPDVVKVDDKGTLCAVGCGKATIKASAKSGVSDSVKVNVTEVVAESIEILGNTDFYVNDTGKMNVQLYPSDTTIQDITWTSSNNKIVKVSKSGGLTCLAEGEATITATQKDVSTSVIITVKAKPAEFVEIKSSQEKSNKLRVNDCLILTATVYPEDATYKTIKWSSSNSEIAVVDTHGNVTAISPGEVVITATTKDGVTGKFEITVSQSFLGFFGKLFRK
ncbi:MAG: Ig-like domain-containing protein [Agathobacter sp.]|nr:Ig-like domain-containing protein [Agathobacter sp.]